MTNATPPAFLPRSDRRLAEQAFSRAAGAPLVGGNQLRLLRDAAENYPAWLAAIRQAEHRVHFENYIINNDSVGREFVAALTERVRAGVRVRLAYDWAGCLFTRSSKLFAPLIAAGGEVRVFNPFHFYSPFGWLTRDHRKSLTVDGRVGYVTGLCVSQHWVGDAQRQIAPWRDTGIEVRGPAVADIDEAFGQIWAQCGEPLPPDDLPARLATDSGDKIGDKMLRVIASSPYASGLYRLDQLIAAMASETLWLTDAYFVGTPAYTQALCAAAQDRVDVRLLVPSSSDIALISPFSRAGYRPLLEAGVRVFEWNGPMIHAKTAVADGRWARVGSSNLNIASWVSNYELDVAIEDEAFARDMEAMYLDDLAHATEIVLTSRHQPRPLERRQRQRLRGRGSSASMATAMRLAAAVQQRELGPVEAAVMFMVSLLLLAIGGIGVYRPQWLALPIAIGSFWLAICMLARAWRLSRPASRDQRGDNDRDRDSGGNSNHRDDV